MKIVYIAGPYRGKSKIKLINRLQVIRNITRARKIAKMLWSKGYAVICPHSNTALFDGVVPDKALLDGDLDILGKCDMLVLTKNWCMSSGTMGELEFACNNRIPVYEWDYEAGKMYRYA